MMEMEMAPTGKGKKEFSTDDLKKAVREFFHPVAAVKQIIAVLRKPHNLTPR